MLLHTYHDPKFDLINDKLNYKKSPHYKHERLLLSYKWLFSIIGTNQVIWCHPAHHHWEPKHGEEIKQWILDVPDDCIIKEVNGYIWDYVIQDCDLVPDVIHLGWENECEKLGIVESDEWHDFLEKKAVEWRKTAGSKEEQWLRELFTKHPTYDSEYLIPFPVKKEWVVDVRHYSEYDITHHEKMHGFAFSNKRDALRYMRIVKSFMKNRNLPYTIEYKKRNTRYHSIDIKRLWENE